MDKKSLEQLGERLKNKRYELGYTQEKTAELSEVSYSSYSKIENAIQSPSLDALIRIAKVLQISLDYLIFGDTGQEIKFSNWDELQVILMNSDLEKLKYVGDLLIQITTQMKKK